MGALVVFPFRHDDLAVFERSVRIAAAHPSVTTVLAVGDTAPSAEVHDACERASELGAAVEAVAEERIGSLRPGKGDAMLTGLRRFIQERSEDHLHFYDADIRSFTPGWIDRAEAALDRGAEVAKHYFDRSSTDAQITWHITRAAATLTWPDSLFPMVRQPLGGELALTRSAAEIIWADDRVRRQSDWGIDTVLTFTMIARRLRLTEVFVPEGKTHGFYGSLTDLRTMLVECLAAIQGLGTAELPAADGDLHEVDPAGPAPQAIRDRVAYDVETTLPLLAAPWVAGEAELTALLPIGAALRQTHLTPGVIECGPDEWAATLVVLLDNFVLGDPAWESLAFRAWTARVLFHTATVVPLGYDRAISELESAMVTYRAHGR